MHVISGRLVGELYFLVLLDKAWVWLVSVRDLASVISVLSTVLSVCPAASVNWCPA